MKPTDARQEAEAERLLLEPEEDDEEREDSIRDWMGHAPWQAAALSVASKQS